MALAAIRGHGTTSSSDVKDLVTCLTNVSISVHVSDKVAVLRQNLLAASLARDRTP